uniref:SH3 domain-containing protein n=2 Tax=Bursaphelenchus xylophilus TaxID=6326 RepID=A0A1I7S6Q0_BURXY
MPLPNGQQPLRIPQPPSHSRQNSALGQRYRHCATPSTSSLSSVTTFPAVPVQPQSSVTSLPVYSSEPGVNRRVYPQTQSTSTLPTRRNEYNAANRQNLERMSYNDLMDLAKRQQLQLQAQRSEFEDRRQQQNDFFHAKSNGLNVPEEVNNLRQQIRLDEAQLQRQANARREVEELVRQNEMARGQLKRLENQYDATDQYLRQATAKVHTLKQQMDQLQARRAAAANAAIAQQRLVNVKGNSENDGIYGQIKKPAAVRPQAQIGPFQVQIAQTRLVNEKPPPPSYDQVDASAYHSLEKSHYHPIGRRVAHAPTPTYNENPWILRTPAVDNFSIRNDSLKAAKRRSWAHVDPPEKLRAGEDVYGTSSSGNSILKKIVEEQKKGRRQLSLASIFGRTKKVEDKKKKVEKEKKEISKPIILDNNQRVSSPQLVPRDVVGMELANRQRFGENSAENRLKFEESEKNRPKFPVNLKDNAYKADRMTPTGVRVENRPESNGFAEQKKLKYDQNSKDEEEKVWSQDQFNRVKFDESRQKFNSKQSNGLSAVKSAESQPKAVKDLNQGKIEKDELAPIVVAECDSDKELNEEPSPSTSTQSTPPEPPTFKEKENEDIVLSMKDKEKIEKNSNEKETKCEEIVVENEEQTVVDRIEDKELEEDPDKQRLSSVSPPEDPKIKESVFDEEKEDWKESDEEYEETVHSPKVVIETLTTDEHAMREATKEIIEQMQQLTYEPKSIIIGEDDEEDEKNLFPMEAQSSTEEISSNDESVSTTDEFLFDEISRPSLKGILKRQTDQKKPKKKMVFDPLVLFLDAALEGDLDLVKEKAAEIPDISGGSDEGITALHNAICASHIDIIRYLIANNADVNAQDADGWTPLHCAASCNNFPIAKMLIENGACVFATSLSDGETPSNKCEASIDGYGGCADFLAIVEKCMGIINNGKVYTAYSYEANNDDELSFQAGEELKVLNKDTGEKNHFHYQRLYYQTPDPSLYEDSLWWLCENRKGQKGLVPRNFLTLFPIWKFVETLNFKPFNLPSNELALDAALKELTTDARRESSSTLDPNDATNSTTSSISNEKRQDDQNSQTSTSSLEEPESPPPLPQPQDFDQPSQIRANA